MKCESCGASMAPNAPECPYCHTTTAFGHHQAQQKAAWEAQQSAHAAHAHRVTQQQREWHLRSRASSLWLWGLFALLVPCLGVPALIAALMAWGVRAEAKRYQLPVPMQVTAALVMSGIGFVCSILIIVFSQIDAAEHAEHVEKLGKKAKPMLDKPMLNQVDACTIAEWTIQRDGWSGTSGNVIDVLGCDGRLLITATDNSKLMLEAMRIKKSTTDVAVDVCFVRRARWTVDRIVAAGSGCDAPAAASDAGPAAPASSPSPDESPGKRGKRR
jgi:hypothetical protein